MIKVKRFSVESEIKRDFRYDRKYRKPQNIFPEVFCPKETFHQEEGKYRKSQTTDAAAYGIYFVDRRVSFGGDIHAVHYHVVVQNAVAEMVYEHESTRDDLQHGA